jgi:DNA-directed RNA polymerase subunit H (RpoH/RPB5)
MSEILFNDINNFKKCMKTISEKDGLLDKRGYKLHSDFTKLDYNELNNYNSIELVGKKPNDNSYCFIYFVNNTSFLSKSYKTKSKNNINNVEEFISNFYNLNNNDNFKVNLIIVLTQLLKINNYILEKKIIEKINVENIQIFTFNNLLFNITKHSRVPQHIRVIKDKKDIELLCEKRNISSIDKLAKIQINDPLANFYGLRVGELFEFKKYNKNSGIYIYYRVCV